MSPVKAHVITILGIDALDFHAIHALSKHMIYLSLIFTWFTPSSIIYESSLIKHVLHNGISIRGAKPRIEKKNSLHLHRSKPIFVYSLHQKGCNGHVKVLNIGTTILLNIFSILHEYSPGKYHLDHKNSAPSEHVLHDQ